MAKFRITVEIDLPSAIDEKEHALDSIVNRVNLPDRLLDVAVFLLGSSTKRNDVSVIAESIDIYR